jgi:tetratricopeptide (TPR) repeat protein
MPNAREKRPAKRGREPRTAGSARGRPHGPPGHGPPGSGRPPGSRRAATGRLRPVHLTALAVAALSFAAYAGVFDHGFVDWDDQDYVQENVLVRTHQYGALLTAVVSNHYHPLTMLTLARDAGSPLVATPFLVTSVALHVMNTLLVFWLALRLARGRLAVAGLTALLFGIHPMHVESVAWVSERKDVLYAFFFLAAAIAYLRYLERRTLGWLGLTFVAFVLSCLSKEMAACFPAVMVLLDFWTGRTLREPRPWLEKIPFVAVALLSGLIVVDLQAGRDFHGLLRVVGPHEVVMQAPPGLSALDRLRLPMYGYMMYLWRMLVPLDLCAFYPYPTAIEARQWPYLIAPFVFVGTLLLAVRDLRRTRILTFGIGWFLITLALVLRWIPAGLVIMADRYTYLAYVGLAFMLAMAIDSAIRTRPGLRSFLWGAAGAFALWLFVLTRAQAETWKDSEALWSRVIALQPRVSSAYLYRGKYRFNTGRLSEAHDDFRTAYGLGVRNGDVYGGLGVAYGAEGKLDSALVMLDRAVELTPDRAALYHNRAITRIGLGQVQEGLADLDHALALGPADVAPIYGTRGFAWLRLQDPRRALADFDRAVAAGAQNDATWFGRGTSRLALGDSAGAVADFQEALRRNPRNGAAQDRLRQLGR